MDPSPGPLLTWILPRSLGILGNFRWHPVWGGAICDAFFLKTELKTNLRVAADPHDMGAKLNNINVSCQCLVLLDESKINTIK